MIGSETERRRKDKSGARLRLFEPEVVTSIDPQQQLENLARSNACLARGGSRLPTSMRSCSQSRTFVWRTAKIRMLLEISTWKIAEKFISYYWPQVRPYAGKVLRQNTGNMPAVISALGRIAGRGIVGLNELKRDAASWTVLVRDVDRVVREMPLWKLQTVGGIPLEFLYENRGRGDSIQLRPGVMFCLRRFHELVTDLVRGAWVRYVRRFNGQVLGESSDLDQFLFGAERAPLDKCLPILREVQEARCLYCERESCQVRHTQTISSPGHVIRLISATTSSSPTPPATNRKPNTCRAGASRTMDRTEPNGG